MSCEAQVWIVTSGYYSDYQIEAAFSSEEAAVAYMKTSGGEEARVEPPMPLLSHLPASRPFREIYAKVGPGGVIGKERWDRTLQVSELDTAFDVSLEAEERDIQRGWRWLRVRGNDVERVAKVFGERLFQLQERKKLEAPVE